MNLLERLGEYLTWADTRIWRIVESLSDEEFNQSLCGEGGSIRKRYVHLAEDTWEWYHDWIGDEPKDEPAFSDMTRDALFSSISDYNDRFIKMINQRKIEKIKLNPDGKVVEIVFEEILFHMVNHATYHRGQIAMGLRLLGKEIQMTDYVPFRINTS
jgi:uncharacterized damage-inducible protein DinB